MANIFKISQPVRVGNFSANPADVSAGAIYWNTSSNELFVANGSSYSQLAISTNEFLSNVFRINDNTNPTKQLAFDVSNVSASTVRSLIMPDANVNLGALTDSNISASAAIAYSKLALSNSIVNADINASAAIAYSKLNLSASIVNADVSASAAIAYSKLALSNSIVNADINASAAIAYSKLDLSASIVNADIANGAAIAVNKLAVVTASRALASDASGFVSATSVTSTELGYLSGVTSAIQTQLGNKIASSEKGANNGVATLDGGGKIPVNQLPSSVMEYKGTWVASTNTPTLANGTGDPGDVYIASDAGTVNFGAGNISFVAGDWVVYNGSIWQKSSSSNSVLSVNGQTGVVSLDSDDISEGATNLYFTNERAEDAVGGILANSSKVSLTYNDATPSIVADIVAGSLVNADVNASAAIAYSKLALSNSIVNADVNASAAIAYSKLALSNSIVNADVNASAAIAYSKLDLTLSIVNGDISASAAIAYSKLSLSNSIVNADINASAAIAYSKLNLSASIVNADVSASAAIAYSKLAALTASRALVSDGSGVVSVSSVTSTELGYVSGVTSAIQAQLNTKLSSVSQDSAPTLGGDLTIAANAFIGVVRRGSSNVASVQEEYLDSLSLTQSTTAVQSSLTFDSRNFKGVSVDYTISNGNDRRKGRLDIACNNVPTVASSSVSLVDQSTETADILVSWSAAINGNNVELSYTTGAGTFNMDADIKRFRS